MDLSARMIRIVNQLDETTNENVRLREANRELRECLEGMVWQFGHHFERDGEPYIGTMGLSDLEHAFRVLGWEEPRLVPVDER